MRPPASFRNHNKKTKRMGPPYWPAPDLILSEVEPYSHSAEPESFPLADSRPQPLSELR